MKYTSLPRLLNWVGLYIRDGPTRITYHWIISGDPNLNFEISLIFSKISRMTDLSPKSSAKHIASIADHVKIDEKGIDKCVDEVLTRIKARSLQM